MLLGIGREHSSRLFPMAADLSAAPRGLRQKRRFISQGEVEKVTDTVWVPADVAFASFTGLTADESPLLILVRDNSRIYALDMELP